MKALPYLPLTICLVSYAILGWVLSFYQALWLAWLFAVSAPMAGALAWSLAEDEAVPQAGCMLLIFAIALSALLFFAGEWPYSVGLVASIIIVFVLPVPNVAYAGLTQAIALAASLYTSIPSNIPNSLILPFMISVPTVIAWAWARMEILSAKFTRRESFFTLSVVAWLGLGIGYLTNLPRSF